MIEYSLIVHAQVLGAYIYSVLIFTADHILLVLPIQKLINKDGNPTTQFKLVTGTKHSILCLRILFCTCVEQKYNAHVGTKALNIHHQAQKGFRVIFFGIPQHQKVCIIYVPQKQKIVSSYDVVIDESF